MINDNNNKDNLKSFHTSDATASTKKPKSKLNPDAQWLILEKDTVNRIRGQIDYANAFLLRSFRLSLRMEED
jgi:hypothetical protein